MVYRGSSLVAQTVKRLSTMRETRVRALGREDPLEDPLEKEMDTHSSILPVKFYGLRSLVGYSKSGRKESDTTERFHFHLTFLSSRGTSSIKVCDPRQGTSHQDV